MYVCGSSIPIRIYAIHRRFVLFIFLLTRNRGEHVTHCAIQVQCAAQITCSPLRLVDRFRECVSVKEVNFQPKRWSPSIFFFQIETSSQYYYYWFEWKSNTERVKQKIKWSNQLRCRWSTDCVWLGAMIVLCIYWNVRTLSSRRLIWICSTECFSDRCGTYYTYYSHPNIWVLFHSCAFVRRSL